MSVAEDDTLERLVDDDCVECERSRSSVADASLDDLACGEDMQFSLRYAYAHMIEETARHCGHLDLLREAIDGSTDQ